MAVGLATSELAMDTISHFVERTTPVYGSLMPITDTLKVPP